jgi:hypothetical protein
MKMLSRTTIVTTNSIALVFFFVSSIHAAEKVRVATGGFSPGVPPYFTYAISALPKQDIEIEDVLMSGGSLSAQALASGQVKVVLTTGAVVPQSRGRFSRGS